MSHFTAFLPKRRVRLLIGSLLISLLAIGVFHTFIGTPKANAATTELAASTQLTPEEQSAAKNQMS
ncbi:MAG: hypothetical protein F2947_10415, partial [Actinobacteria bacterium]|nr:hypothetical protein [Actinomycetota bacterium]